LAEPDKAERSAALAVALGIDRLKSATTVRVQRPNLLHWWHGLDASSQRFILKTLLLSGLAAFGFWSIVKLGKTNPDQTWWAFMLESAARTGQLFTFQYHSQPGTDPWITQLARLVLPAAAFFVGMISFSRRFGRRFFVGLATRRGNHLVLIGESAVSVALARAFREKLNRPVIGIVPAEPASALSPLEKAGADLVIGDARDPAVLQAAGVQKAAALIAPEDGGGVVGLVAAVAEACRMRSRDRALLPFVVRLDHGDLRALAAVQLSSALRRSNVDLKPYVRERTVARGLLGRYPPDWGQPPGPHDIHAVIVGLGSMGGALLLQLAGIAVPSPGRRTVLTVVDRDAVALQERLLTEVPGLAQCAELRFKGADVAAADISPAQFEDWTLDPIPASAIYICCGEDRQNLAIALGLRRAMHHREGVSAPMFVYQRNGPMEVRALPQIHGRDIDTLRIVPFGSIEEEADPVFLIEGEIDELARRLHENYLAGGTGSRETMVPWSDLDEGYRAANRSLADHLQLKLRSLALHACAGAAHVDGWTWTAAEKPRLEELAQQEHDRWCRDRWLRGWTYGEKRNDNQQQHPDLVPYDRLDEVGRDKDRRIMLNLPKDLGQLGMSLRRDRRVGIWFESGAAAPSETLVEALLVRLEELMAAAPAEHWQLVLPLRASAELALAATLAARHDVAIDVAIIGAPGFDDVGPAIDRVSVQKLIAAADRAFVLLSGKQADVPDGARLAALREVCDSIWIAGDSSGALRIEQLMPESPKSWG
jgi:hypothetical protein